MTTDGTDKESSDTSIFGHLSAEPQVSVVPQFGATTRAEVFLRVAVSGAAHSVKLSFDPVSAEEVRQTRELNRSIRLGFVPPTSSTR